MEYGIQICHTFLSETTICIVPNHLSSDVQESIINNIAYEDCFKSNVTNFWLNLKMNSILYF